MFVATPLIGAIFAQSLALPSLASDWEEDDHDREMQWQPVVRSDDGTITPVEEQVQEPAAQSAPTPPPMVTRHPAAQKRNWFLDPTHANGQRSRARSPQRARAVGSMPRAVLTSPTLWNAGDAFINNMPTYAANYYAQEDANAALQSTAGIRGAGGLALQEYNGRRGLPTYPKNEDTTYSGGSYVPGYYRTDPMNVLGQTDFGDPVPLQMPLNQPYQWWSATRQ